MATTVTARGFCELALTLFALSTFLLYDFNPMRAWDPWHHFLNHTLPTPVLATWMIGGMFAAIWVRRAR